MPPKFVVFDTETTGIPLYRDKATGQPVPADDPRQPRIASFAYIVADEAGDIISDGKAFVRPDGWRMADFDAMAFAAGKTPASEINGLTDDFLQSVGVPIGDVLALWNGFLDQGLIAVAFNAQFDCKMMRAELRRAGMPDRFEDTPNICVMRGLDPYYHDGLMIRNGFVKLSVACEYFGITNDNPHDAGADTEAARAILARLIVDDRLPEARVHLAKGRAA
ncbi:Exonuclease [Loktanella atrilutea]|uniref:Exonuclease n=1 Tax=Loktanella atrilutea TaxID=366533 RepID=A0A1M4W9W7_LOKAT|nr:3'-5' exonuclease [Loktanella atrilutea]SHE77873.1 Exonuclease [Loktanella atrilutea]